MKTPDIVTTWTAVGVIFRGVTQEGDDWLYHNCRFEPWQEGLCEHSLAPAIIMAALENGLRVQDNDSGKFAGEPEGVV